MSIYLPGGLGHQTCDSATAQRHEKNIPSESFIVDGSKLPDRMRTQGENSLLILLENYQTFR